MRKRERRYKFRAEFPHDVWIFWGAVRLCARTSMEITEIPIPGRDGEMLPTPDREVAFTEKGELSLENLRWIADHITDCHVIAETIALEEDYTGERIEYWKLKTKRPNLNCCQKLLESLQTFKDYLVNEAARVDETIVAVEGELLVASLGRADSRIHEACAAR